MPDTNGARMLTAPEAQAASKAAVSPADRMHPQLSAARPPRTATSPCSRAEGTPRPADSWLGRGVLIAGLAMIPWVFILACSLPPAIRAAHWSTAWAGLNALEAAGLMTTGVALIGRYSWLCLPAAVTSTLLVIDAWFDITTSAPGPAATVAIAMAVFPELPMAGLCAVLAIRHAPDPRRRAGPQRTRRAAGGRRARRTLVGCVSLSGCGPGLPVPAWADTTTRPWWSGSASEPQTARRLRPRWPWWLRRSESALARSHWWQGRGAG